MISLSLMGFRGNFGEAVERLQRIEDLKHSYLGVRGKNDMFLLQFVLHF
jgi:hypothetical protein